MPVYDYVNNNYFYDVGQFFGLIAAILTIVSWQWKNKQSVFLLWIIAGFFWSISYFVLQSYGAGLSSILGSFILILDRFKIKHRNMIILGCISYTIIIVTIRIFHGQLPHPFSVIICSISFVLFLLTIRLPNNLFRISIMVSMIFWVINNLIVMSIGGLACNLFETISIIIGFSRFFGLSTIFNGKIHIKKTLLETL